MYEGTYNLGNSYTAQQKPNEAVEQYRKTANALELKKKELMENPEASHLFTAGLMIAALLLFFAAIFSDSIYYHEKYRFGIRDAAASCGFLLIGAAIMLLVCSMIYGFLIGALIAACGNFVMLLMKYKGVWAK